MYVLMAAQASVLLLGEGRLLMPSTRTLHRFLTCWLAVLRAELDSGCAMHKHSYPLDCAVLPAGLSACCVRCSWAGRRWSSVPPCTGKCTGTGAGTGTCTSESAADPRVLLAGLSASCARCSWARRERRMHQQRTLLTSVACRAHAGLSASRTRCSWANLASMSQLQAPWQQTADCCAACRVTCELRTLRPG